MKLLKFSIHSLHFNKTAEPAEISDFEPRLKVKYHSIGRDKLPTVGATHEGLQAPSYA